MTFRTVETDPAELPLERTPFFRARLEHLKANPTLLLPHLNRGHSKLLEHLRTVANQGVQAAAKLVSKGARRDEAEEAVLAEVVAFDRPSQTETPTTSPSTPDLSQRLRQFETWMRSQPYSYPT